MELLMTVGSYDRSFLTETAYNVNGAYNGTIKVGRRTWKTWSGGDGVTATRPKGRKRFYTTLDRRTGRVITKSFYERPPKRSVSKEPHNYTMSSMYYRGSPGSAQVTTPFWSQAYTNWTFPADNPPLPTLPSWTANDDIKLIGKLKEKMRGSDFNLGVFLGESRESFQMIGDSAIKLAQALRYFRKGNVIGAVNVMTKSASRRDLLKTELSRRGLWSTHLRRNAVNQSSGTWQELQYGWLPLLSDIRNGAIMLAHKLNVPFRQRIVARHTVQNRDLNPTSSIWGMSDGVAAVSKQIVAYVSEPESIPKFLGLTDPELIVWELIPFSFVADWVIPIGDWLDARAFAHSLSGTFVTTTYARQRWSGVKGKSFDTGLITGTSTVDNVDYECSVATMNRVVSSNLDVPLPRVKPLSEVLSLGHCLNGIALLAQVAKTMVK